ncbi:hypothetical protein FB45DRAFT_1074248 [Roridomyces roridus]|uniref:DUF7330 domain-containing protein n=1 Tax=Roridomyces roridus TaxID=1738132 RepID=A0AAD7AWI2_9AGAR|nr:hypothetical protein FB45DRAFT_1074248 [Roridomyces roridus]
MSDHKHSILPTAVQTPASVLPPYTEIADESGTKASAMKDWYSDAQNNILVSRNFRSITKARFTVDPNIRTPVSLLGAVSSWEDGSGSRSSSSKPRNAVELFVGWGRVDAVVCVLPVSESVLCKEKGYPCRQPVKKNYSPYPDPPPPCLRQSRLSAGSFIGDVTIKVDMGGFSPHTARLDLKTYTSWGQVAVFLPRSFHGPLVTSCAGIPRLSSTLAPLCTPIKEVGRNRHWFVGDVEAWHAAKQHADEASVSSVFGTVWIGYEGEEKEAKKALRWSAVQWIGHIVVLVVTLRFMRVMLELLLWFVRLMFLTSVSFLSSLWIEYHSTVFS